MMRKRKVLRQFPNDFESHLDRVSERLVRGNTLEADVGRQIILNH